MPTLNYWDGANWVPVSTGGGGGGTPGPQGPAGPAGADGQDGESIVVVEQATAPSNPKPGTIWFQP